MLPALASITDLIDKSESHLAGLKALKARYEELNAEEAAAIETAKAAKKAEEANAKKQMEPTE
jgi:hypothetical protein